MEKNKPHFPGMPEAAHEGLRIISQCPMCNTTYNPLSAEVLSRKDNAQLMFKRCKKCSSSILTLVVAGVIGVSSMGLITDLTSDDVLKFQNGSKMNGDDAINIHEAVKDRKFILKLIK